MTFNTRLSVVAIIFALVILIGFVLSVPHARELREASTQEGATASTPPVVTLKDTYKKGTHTLSGGVQAPDACTSAAATAAYASTSGTGITLDIAMPASSGICLDVPTEAMFTATVAAPSGVPIRVRVNGALATTTP